MVQPAPRSSDRFTVPSARATYGITGLPETFFIGARGRIVGHVIGALTPSQLRQGVAAAISGRPAEATLGGERQSTR